MDKDKIKEAAKELATQLGVEEKNEKELSKIQTLITDAMFLIIDFTGRDEGETLPSSFYVYAKQLAIIAWNKEGMEGETSRSEGGISQTFETGIPESIQAALIRHRKGSVIRHATKKA